MNITVEPSGKLPPQHELDALECAARGMTYSQAAEWLGVRVPTVRDALHSLQKRLDAQNATHALYLCVQRGYIVVTNGANHVRSDTSDGSADRSGNVARDVGGVHSVGAVQ